MNVNEWLLTFLVGVEGVDGAQGMGQTTVPLDEASDHGARFPAQSNKVHQQFDRDWYLAFKKYSAYRTAHVRHPCLGYPPPYLSKGSVRKAMSSVSTVEIDLVSMTRGLRLWAVRSGFSTAASLCCSPPPPPPPYHPHHVTCG